MIITGADATDDSKTAGAVSNDVEKERTRTSSQAAKDSLEIAASTVVIAKKIKSKEKFIVETEKRTDDIISNGIIDIMDIPDVAVWAKGIRDGRQIPSDKVKEPSKNISIEPHIKQKREQQLRYDIGNNNRGNEDIISRLNNEPDLTVDPANKTQVAKVVTEHESLSDEFEYAQH